LCMVLGACVHFVMGSSIVHHECNLHREVNLVGKERCLRI